MYHKIINNFPVLQSYFSGAEAPAANKTPSGNTKLQGLQKDTFEKSAKTSTPEINELNRFFPNNEIYKIFDDIVKTYGIENIPKLKLEANSNGNMDFASTSHISNTITLNLDNILTDDIYKFLIEKDGKKSYCMNEKTKELRTLKTTDKNEINIIIEGNKALGAENCTAEPLSDDDKKKLIIFSLAHELEHCYQNQLIRHTQDLDEFEMIKTGLKKNPSRPKFSPENENNIFEELKVKYYKNHGEKDFEKIYPQDSPEGKKAVEWYNASINYTDFNKDYDSYAKNPLEVDANNRAHQYLTEHYGDFKFEVD